MLTRRFLSLLLLSMLVIPACGPDLVNPPLVDPSLVDPPVDSSNRRVDDGKFLVSPPEVIVLVVDDAATPEAAQLRAQIVESVRAGLEDAIRDRWSGCGNPDPAAFHPGDIRLVIARPSAPDDVALLTPTELPSLAWITKRSTADEVKTVTAGAAAALEQRFATAGELYRPLRAAKRAVELVKGARPPVTDAEAAFVASLLPEVWVRLVVASTRDDEDTVSVNTLVIDPSSRQSSINIGVVGPFAASGSTCKIFKPGDTRLELWASKNPTASQAPASLVKWPCDEQASWYQLLASCCVDCGARCEDRVPTVSEEGVAACRAYVDQTDLERCDPARGVQDPDGKPTFIERQGAQLRRCEVLQLTGAALEACRFTLDCSGCPSGFCATEVPELTLLDQCEPGKRVSSLRFVGGALDAPGGYIHTECDTQPVPGP